MKDEETTYLPTKEQQDRSAFIDWSISADRTAKSWPDQIFSYFKRYHIDTLQAERDKLKELLSKSLETIIDEEKSRLQAEIQTLKEERDRFAIGFAKFCQVDPRGRTFKDLLEEFKNVSKKE